jgi:hypothetical protein
MFLVISSVSVEIQEGLRWSFNIMCNQIKSSFFPLVQVSGRGPKVSYYAFCNAMIECDTMLGKKKLVEKDKLITVSDHSAALSGG